ncbi:uncharacterized protein PHALS_01806 [Plasmopara halstedii]|uniref:Uncharacterized protein n=1 Tax=Plasmopara halstedii TaxID=4781 RepID=A0A0N7L6X8_PLAHL|nr:uncharacterized protein PHALS_01806 [Plasmopara halstedii]CEG45515.1 hypothetical protein PHALS_01806 [Plasmopara halstedii]|eukprot:XP_024581884.1 hypothetical protein PHALS_01806 [Plasmopara halstedii]
MHRNALRGLYSGYLKTKNQAVISPIVDDTDGHNNGTLFTGELDNGFGIRSHAPSHFNSNNELEGVYNMSGAAVSVDIHNIPETAENSVQRKSAYDARMLSRPQIGQYLTPDNDSNQEMSTFAGPLVYQKYAVLGQKHQWRKSRSSRSRQHQTISPVDANYPAERAESDAFGFRRGVLTSSSALSHDERHSSQELSSIDTRIERISSSQSNSSGRDSDYSQGRSQGEHSNTSEDGRQFVVTKQKKSKYSAKLHLHGQKPLYLGRYKNQEAALAACESAYSVVTTPRK